MDDLALVVPQLDGLLVGQALEVFQLVGRGDDLGNEVGNLLLNLSSESELTTAAALPDFLLVLLPLPAPLPLHFTCVFCADFVLGLTALGATSMCEGKCTDLDLVLCLPALDVDAVGLAAIRHSTICQTFVSTSKIVRNRSSIHLCS